MVTDSMRMALNDIDEAVETIGSYYSDETMPAGIVEKITRIESAYWKLNDAIVEIELLYRELGVV